MATVLAGGRLFPGEHHHASSANGDGDRLDGLELSAGRWIVEPAEVLAASSSFFGDARLFPAGSATLDCALLMRDIPATWTAMTRNRERDFEEFRPC